MKRILTLLFLTISLACFSQKVKLKDKVVYVDDVAWLNYQDCGSFDRTCSLLNKNNDEIIFFKFISVDGGEPSIPANPKGTLSYVEIKFLGFGKSFEIQKTQKDIIKLLFISKVINENGELDEEKAARLVEKYGTEFSDRLNRTNSTNNTVIIKEQPSGGSGVNINIGRH